MIKEHQTINEGGNMVFCSISCTISNQISASQFDVLTVHNSVNVVFHSFI